MDINASIFFSQYDSHITVLSFSLYFDIRMEPMWNLWVMCCLCSIMNIFSLSLSLCVCVCVLKNAHALWMSQNSHKKLKAYLTNSRFTWIECETNIYVIPCGVPFLDGNAKLSNLMNWSCAMGYGVGSGSPLSPSFNFSLELVKSSQVGPHI